MYSSNGAHFPQKFQILKHIQDSVTYTKLDIVYTRYPTDTGRRIQTKLFQYIPVTRYMVQYLAVKYSSPAGQVLQKIGDNH